MQLHSLLLAATTLVGFTYAHPGHDLTEEVAERRSFINSIQRRSLDHCSEHLKSRGFEAKNSARRSAAILKARWFKGLHKRANETWTGSHNATHLGITMNTPIEELFTGNASCVLTPEVTQGPYCQ